MDYLKFRIIQNNRICFLITILILSILTVSFPHSGGEAYANHAKEMMMKQTVVKQESSVYIKRVYKRLGTLLRKLFMLTQILMKVSLFVYKRMSVFLMPLFNIVILQLLSVLFVHFHVGKFKHEGKSVYLNTGLNLA